MTEFQFTPQTQIIDAQTGRLTREGFLLLNNINRAVSEATSTYILVDAVQTLTNKTIDGDDNTLQDIGTGSLKNVTGVDADVVTGTAGTASQLSMWNGDGDLVDSGILAALVVTTTATQTLTNKTLTTPVISQISNTGTLTLPTATTTLVGRDTTDTLTNKTFGDPPIFPEYTVAGVPSAATYDNGVIIVSNETGGRTLATSDGTNWRRVADGNIIS